LFWPPRGALIKNIRDAAGCRSPPTLSKQHATHSSTILYTLPLSVAMRNGPCLERGFGADVPDNCTAPDGTVHRIDPRSGKRFFNFYKMLLQISVSCMICVCDVEQHRVENISSFN